MVMNKSVCKVSTIFIIFIILFLMNINSFPDKELKGTREIRLRQKKDCPKLLCETTKEDLEALANTIEISMDAAILSLFYQNWKEFSHTNKKYYWLA